MICFKCDGKGKNKSGKHSCKKCGGTGVISSEFTIEIMNIISDEIS